MLFQRRFEKILEKQFENAGEIYYILKIFSRLRQKLEPEMYETLGDFGN